MDGELLQGEGSFDLIVSSLAFQWFHDPLGNLKQLSKRLAPGGHLAFTTLGRKTFMEWRELCDQYKIPCGLHHYHRLKEWKKAWPASGTGKMSANQLVEEHDSPCSFLQGLKRTGTSLSPLQYQPVPGIRLRQIFRCHAAEKHNFPITYHVLFGHFIKDRTGKKK